MGSQIQDGTQTVIQQWCDMDFVHRDTFEEYTAQRSYAHPSYGDAVLTPQIQWWLML